MFKKGKNKDKLSRYKDVSGGFSNSELKWGEWYLRHKVLLRKILTGCLVAWSIITLGYGLGYFAYYFSYGYFQDQEMMARQTVEFENYSNLQNLYKPQDLQFSQASVFNSLSELYDFFAKVRNPNKDWMARITFKFSFSGGETEIFKDVLLPGSERPIAIFGVLSNSYPTNISLSVENIEWKRVKPHLVKNVQQYISERNNFLVDNFKFTRQSKSNNIPSNMIEFDVFNDSIYSFWNQVFYVEFLKNNRTVGVAHVVVEEFMSEEIRHVDLRSYVNNLDISNIAVYSVSNVFDNSEYIK